MIRVDRSTAAADFIPIVDVLRALAIALVVLYHAVPDLAPGGLVGVDVFFVISGFLILGQIGKATQAGTFGLIAFYKRRALRIIPPYAIVVTATVVAAAIILVTPQDLLSFKRDLVWSGAFAANVLFADTLGYFDSVGTRHPLLHLWSLGVEEQFYIVAPLVMLAAVALAGLVWKLHRYRIAIVAAALLGCVSLVASILVSDASPYDAFYLTQFRLWEFLLGGGMRLAIPMLRRMPGWLSDAAVVAGLGLIIYAALSYSTAITYPGSFVLLPVVGTAVVIAAGAERSGLLVRGLANPPVLWLGLISYELYLWHWPILVLARFANFGQLPVELATACVIGAIGLAAATHFGLARTIGTLRRSGGRLKDLLVLGVILLGYGALIAVLYFGIGAAMRSVQASVPPLLVPDLQRAPTCNLVAPRGMEGCVATGGKGMGLLLGDSHATANFNVLAEHAREFGAGLEFAAFPGCSPFLTVDRERDSQPATCRRWHADIKRQLVGGEKRYAFGILSAQWAFHITDLFGPTQEEAFIAGMRGDIAALKAAGASRILVIGAPPLLPREPGDCIVRADRFGYERDRQCAVSRARFDQRNGRFNGWIATAIAGDPDIRYVDLGAAFCDDKWCSPVVGDVALFTDHDHLSVAGTELLAKAAGGDLEWVMSAAP